MAPQAARLHQGPAVGVVPRRGGGGCEGPSHDLPPERGDAQPAGATPTTSPLRGRRRQKQPNGALVAVARARRTAATAAIEEGRTERH